MKPVRIRDVFQDPISEFGRRVKVALVSMGWTQEKLAAACGIRRQSVSLTLRSNAPELATVERYSTAMRIPPEKLDPSYPRRKALEEGRRRKVRARAERAEQRRG